MDPCERQGDWTPESLATIRRKNGFTSQRSLAKASGVSQQTINRADEGQKTISFEAASQLAPRLGLTPRDLFVSHNLAVVCLDLDRGLIDRRHAIRQRNSVEEMLGRFEALPLHQLDALTATLGKLNAAIGDFDRRHPPPAPRRPLDGILEAHRERQSPLAEEPGRGTDPGGETRGQEAFLLLTPPGRYKEGFLSKSQGASPNRRSYSKSLLA